MKHEEWRDIAGYEGIYQVSNFGHVRSLDRTIVTKRGYSLFFAGKDIKAHLHTNGRYLFVNLSFKGKKTPKDVHRLVAIAFVPNPDNLPCVDHIDCDTNNNMADNLRWVTQKENIRHGIKHGNIDLDLKRRILMREDIRKLAYDATRIPVVRSDGKTYESINKAAMDTGCCFKSVWNNVMGKTKTCFGYTFKRQSTC